jgi:hypothetical protein
MIGDIDATALLPQKIHQQHAVFMTVDDHDSHSVQLSGVGSGGIFDHGRYLFQTSGLLAARASVP